MVTTHTQAKTQDQQAVRSEDRLETTGYIGDDVLGGDLVRPVNDRLFSRISNMGCGPKTGRV